MRNLLYVFIVYVALSKVSFAANMPLNQRKNFKNNEVCLMTLFH